MADLTPSPDRNGDTGDDTDVGPDLASGGATPRWVKVFGIVAAIVIFLFVIVLLTRGPHRPDRHMGGSHVPPSASHTP